MKSMISKYDGMAALLTTVSWLEDTAAGAANARVTDSKIPRTALSQTAKDDRAELLGTASGSHCESEKLVHESNLPDGVSFRQPSDLSFADHVRRFITCNSAQSAIQGPEPEPVFGAGSAT